MYDYSIKYGNKMLLTRLELFQIIITVAFNSNFVSNMAILLQQVSIFTSESGCCFQRVLAIAILSVRLSICLSVRHTSGSVKNGAS